MTRVNNDNRLAKRLNAEKRFQFYCISAIAFSLIFVVILFINIFSSGYSAFYKTVIEVDFDVTQIEEDIATLTDLEIRKLDIFRLSKKTIYSLYPDLDDRKSKKMLIKIFSIEYEDEIKSHLIKNKNTLSNIETVFLTASDDVDQVKKGNYPRELSEDRRRIKDIQLSFYDDLEERGKVKYIFNIPFLTRGDSREPELAGVGGSLLGSFFTIITVLILSFPIGILSAIYLQEFAKSNRITDFIEININNLAAVPSIVYGLLALQILLATIQLPRSTPLVAGITLALMTLPRIIIPCRASLKAVPPSIREGALAVGASKFQSVFHHVVPLALPGTLSGTIIGLAQALGETAPLILIGMVAFVVDIPSSPIDPSSSLPVQVYLWSESAERGFVEKTSATIMMLLSFLIVMNFIAVYLRQKFEKRWN